MAGPKSIPTIPWNILERDQILSLDSACKHEVTVHLMVFGIFVALIMCIWLEAALALSNFVIRRASHAMLIEIRCVLCKTCIVLLELLCFRSFWMVYYQCAWTHAAYIDWSWYGSHGLGSHSQMPLPLATSFHHQWYEEFEFAWILWVLSNGKHKIYWLSRSLHVITWYVDGSWPFYSDRISIVGILHFLLH